MLTHEQQIALVVQVVDVRAAKRYLRALRAVCDEAIASQDEAVLLLALSVVADQRRMVARLRRVASLLD